MYVHFRPKTFRDYVFGAEVFHIFALVPKCLGQFGTRVHETLRTQNKNRPICIVRVNIDPHYIRYSNGMVVLEKRLTKVVSDYSLSRVSSHALSATNIIGQEATVVSTDETTYTTLVPSLTASKYRFDSMKLPLRSQRSDW